MTNNPERIPAAKQFVDAIMARAYDGAIESVLRVLGDGPSGRRPAPRLVALHQWFQSLEQGDREQVSNVVQQAAFEAVFGTLVVLDGASGGWPIRGEISDFALYLQKYRDDESEEEDAPETRIKLNPMNSLQDLHDLFLEIVQERKGLANASNSE